jgi:DNA-binding protein H-NS
MFDPPFGQCGDAEIDTIFSQMDTDHSGELSLREINRELRRGADRDVKASLSSMNAVGAAGVIETSAKNKSGDLRKEGARRGTLFQLDLSDAQAAIEKSEAAKAARKANTNAAAARARARQQAAKTHEESPQAVSTSSSSKGMLASGGPSGGAKKTLVRHRHSS